MLVVCCGVVVTDEVAVKLVGFGFGGWVVAVEAMLWTSVILVWFVSVGRVVLMLLDVDGSAVMLVGC